MKDNKKPSIYSDRSSIGSAEDLDEYGVWVKSEPQVLSSGDFNDAAAIEEASDTSVSDDAFSIDDAVLDVDAASQDSLGSDIEFPDNIDDIGIDDAGEPSELEDFGIPVPSMETEGVEEKNLDDFNFEDQIDDDLDVDFGTSETTDDETPGKKHGEIDDINEMLNIEAASMEDDARTDDDFIFRGEDSGGADEETPDDETLDTDLGDITVDETLDADLGDISIDETADTDLGDISIEETADTDLGDISIEETDISDDDISMEDPLDVPGDDITLDTSDDNFDIPTVKSIENNISSQDNFADGAGGELSSHLLMKIANELSSIRGELTELKKEFSLVRGGVVPKSEKQDGSSDGFFHDEDDETIALTGDELDNIINTSEQITETPEHVGTDDEDETIALTTDELNDIITTTEEDEEDEAIALTGDELDNIMSSADFTEEAGSEEIEISEDVSLDEDVSLGEDVSLDDDLSIDMSDDISLDTDDVSLDTSDAALDSDEVSIEDVTDVGDDDLSIDTSDGISIDDDLSIAGDDLSIDALDDISLDAGDTSLDDDITIDEEIILDDDILSGASGDVAFDTSDVSLETDDVSLDTDDVSVDDDVSADSGAVQNIDIDLDIDIQSDGASAASGESEDDFADFTNMTDSEAEDFTANEFNELDDIAEEDLSSLDENTVLELDEELEQLREEGVVPTTNAPENISYLEEDDDLSAEPDSIDLSDAVIDEPDLSLDDITDTIAEPSSISETLDSLDDLIIDDDLSIDDDVPEIGLEDTLASAPSEEPLAEEPSAEPLEETEEISDDFGTDDFNEPLETIDDFDDIEDISMDDEIEPTIPAAPTPAPTPAPVAAPAPTPAPVVAPTPAPAPVAAQSPAPAAAPVQAPAVQAAPAPMGVPSMMPGGKGPYIPSELKSELRNILSYMDQLLESLPEEKIEEFAKSEYFDSYKKLFKDLGLV